MINVSKTFLPPLDEYQAQLTRIWENGWITNNGQLLLELEEALRIRLHAKHLLVCSNGTIALQIALKALAISGEVITTPFSYVATTTSILWENASPVFVDILDNNFCIDPGKIEAAITAKTSAILATHVYGYPCDVVAIEKIALKYNLKVIYDAAHAFGTSLNGTSIYNYGDVSTCSFHATKIFHMAEGGCVTTNNAELARQLGLYRSFGHIGDDYYSIGINAKNSELHAAMGLCNLKYIDQIQATYKQKWEFYKTNLVSAHLQLLEIAATINYNYSYFPLVFGSASQCDRVIAGLKENDIFPRRYFYPSLNQLNYVQYQPCPVSESIAERVICLPLYYDLSLHDQESVINIILNNL